MFNKDSGGGVSILRSMLVSGTTKDDKKIKFNVGNRMPSSLKNKSNTSEKSTSKQDTVPSKPSDGLKTDSKTVSNNKPSPTKKEEPAASVVKVSEKKENLPTNVSKETSVPVGKEDETKKIVSDKAASVVESKTVDLETSSQPGVAKDKLPQGEKKVLHVQENASLSPKDPNPMGQTNNTETVPIPINGIGASVPGYDTSNKGVRICDPLNFNMQRMGSKGNLYKGRSPKSGIYGKQKIVSGNLLFNNKYSVHYFSEPGLNVRVTPNQVSPNNITERLKIPLFSWIRADGSNLPVRPVDKNQNDTDLNNLTHMAVETDETEKSKLQGIFRSNGIVFKGGIGDKLRQTDFSAIDKVFLSKPNRDCTYLINQMAKSMLDHNICENVVGSKLVSLRNKYDTKVIWKGLPLGDKDFNDLVNTVFGSSSSFICYGSSKKSQLELIKFVHMSAPTNVLNENGFVLNSNYSKENNIPRTITIYTDDIQVSSSIWNLFVDSYFCVWDNLVSVYQSASDFYGKTTIQEVVLQNMKSIATENFYCFENDGLVKQIPYSVPSYVNLLVKDTNGEYDLNPQTLKDANTFESIIQITSQHNSLVLLSLKDNLQNLTQDQRSGIINYVLAQQDGLFQSITVVASTENLIEAGWNLFGISNMCNPIAMYSDALLFYLKRVTILTFKRDKTKSWQIDFVFPVSLNPYISIENSFLENTISEVMCGKVNVRIDSENGVKFYEHRTVREFLKNFCNAVLPGINKDVSLSKWDLSFQFDEISLGVEKFQSEHSSKDSYWLLVLYSGTSYPESEDEVGFTAVVKNEPIKRKGGKRPGGINFDLDLPVMSEEQYMNSTLVKTLSREEFEYEMYGSERPREVLKLRDKLVTQFEKPDIFDVGLQTIEEVEDKPKLLVKRTEKIDINKQKIEEEKDAKILADWKLARLEKKRLAELEKSNLENYKLQFKDPELAKEYEAFLNQESDSRDGGSGFNEILVAESYQLFKGIGSVIDPIDSPFVADPDLPENDPLPNRTYTRVESLEDKRKKVEKRAENFEIARNPDKLLTFADRQMDWKVRTNIAKESSFELQKKKKNIIVNSGSRRNLNDTEQKQVDGLELKIIYNDAYVLALETEGIDSGFNVG